MVTVYCPAGVAVVVLTVVVTGMGVPETGMTLDDGEKAQLTPVAGSLQKRATVLFNDPVAVSWVANVELVPGNNVRVVGDGALSVRLATFKVTGI